eukprot:6185832-Pleurochrysis_carterae.AAC.2
MPSNAACATSNFTRSNVMHAPATAVESAVRSASSWLKPRHASAWLAGYKAHKHDGRAGDPNRTRARNNTPDEDKSNQAGNDPSVGTDPLPAGAIADHATSATPQKEATKEMLEPRALSESIVSVRKLLTAECFLFGVLDARLLLQAINRAIATTRHLIAVIERHGRSASFALLPCCALFFREAPTSPYSVSGVRLPRLAVDGRVGVPGRREPLQLQRGNSLDGRPPLREEDAQPHRRIGPPPRVAMQPGAHSHARACSERTGPGLCYRSVGSGFLLSWEHGKGDTGCAGVRREARNLGWISGRRGESRKASEILQQ